MPWITHKKCSSCGELKSIHDFHRDRTAKSGRKSACKQCASKKRRERYKRLDIPRNKKKVERNKRFIAEYLLQHPCVDCGETDPVVLQFDHVYGKKDSNVSYFVHKPTGIKRIKKEIAKCEVRCANCHIRRHAYERSLADLGKDEHDI